MHLFGFLLICCILLKPRTQGIFMVPRVETNWPFSPQHSLVRVACAVLSADLSPDGLSPSLCLHL